jgi:hypothetical protein
MKTVLCIVLAAVFVAPAFADKISPVPSVNAMGGKSGVLAGDRGASFSTGFEPPYTTGYLGTQQGWSCWKTWTVTQTQPTIVTTGSPFAGTQHLRFARLGTKGAGYYGADAPLLSPAYEAGSTATISLQTKIVQTGGADYFLELSDSVSGNISVRIDFDYSTARGIYVFDYTGADPNAPYAYYNTGATWTTNTYKELKVVETMGGGIQYYYGGTLIYNDVDGTHAATRLDTVTLYCDDYQANTTSDFAYFDNLSITPEPASFALLGLGVLLRRRR